LANKALLSDKFSAALQICRRARRWRGRFAPRHRGAGYHPHAARRSAPTITRIQQTNPPASKLAYGFAADPPPRYE